MSQDLILFALAFTASVITPGPDTMTIFGRALANGATAALPFSIGLVLGKLVLLTLALTGLASLARNFETVFYFVKLAGAAYLIWLGISLWRRSSLSLGSAALQKSSWQEVLLGTLLTISNPYALIFYVALLPNVIDMAGVNIGSYLSLCITLTIITFLTAGLYAVSAQFMRGFIQSKRTQKIVNRSSGSIMIGAGVVVATR